MSSGRGAVHDLDLSDIDELDEISGDEQWASVWCAVHKKYEWHWIPYEPTAQRVPAARKRGLPR